MATLKQQYLTIAVSPDLFLTARLPPQVAKKWARMSEEDRAHAEGLLSHQISIGAGQGMSLLIAFVSNCQTV